MKIKPFFQSLLARLKSKKLEIFISHYQSAEMDLSSIAVAYYLMLTVFPLIVIATNIFPYFNIDTTDLLQFLKQHLPSTIYESVSKIVISTFSKTSSGLLGVATLTAIWTMSKSLTSLQKAINKAYSSLQNRSFLLSHLVSLGIGFIILFLLTFVLVFATFSQTILEVLRSYFNIGNALFDSILGLAQPVTFVVCLFSLMLLYYLLPDTKIKNLKCVLPGSLFTTFMLVYFSSLASQYMFHSFSSVVDVKVFGSVVIFVFMIWFIFLSRILIIGAVLNASFQEIYYGKLEARPENFKQLIRKIKNKDIK